MKAKRRLGPNLQMRDVKAETEADLTCRTLQKLSFEPGVSLGKGPSPIPDDVTNLWNAVQSGNLRPYSLHNCIYASIMKS